MSSAGDDGDEAERHAGVRAPTRCRPTSRGVVEGVVDGHQRRPGGVEQRRGDRGAVAAGAVHPHLAGRDVVEPRRAARAAGCSRRPSMRASACSSARRTSRTTTWRWWRTWARSAKVAVGNDAELAGRVQSCGRAGGARGGPVDADADQLALGLGDLLGGLAEQGERGAPGDQPAEVGRERAVEAEVQRAGRRGRRRRRSGCAGRRPTRRPRCGGAARRRRPARAADRSGARGPAALAGAMCA